MSWEFPARSRDRLHEYDSLVFSEVFELHETSLFVLPKNSLVKRRNYSWVSLGQSFLGKCIVYVYTEIF